MTRRILSLLAVLALAAAAPSTLAQAPSYQPIRVDLTVYGAYAAGATRSFGIGAALEPKYNLTDQLAVGLRFEGTAIISEDVGVGAQSVSMGARAVSTFLAKADYYLTTSSVRPFVGLGAGLYRIGSGSQSVDNTGSGSVSVVQRAESFQGFGFCPQLGVNFGGFRLAATYHVVTGGKQVVVTQTVGAAPQETSLSKNFYAFELGGTFGGNRRASIGVDAAPMTR
jgi:hypothetical protein